MKRIVNEYGVVRPNPWIAFTMDCLIVSPLQMASFMRVVQARVRDAQATALKEAQASAQVHKSCDCVSCVWYSTSFASACTYFLPSLLL